MNIFDFEQISKDSEKKNEEYKELYEQEYKRFEKNLLNELEDFLRYYGIRISINDLEKLIEEIKPMLTNQMGYKEIMTKNNNILADLRKSPNLNIEEAKEFSISEQKQISLRSNLEECIMDIRKMFKNRIRNQIREDKFDELISVIQKQIRRLDEKTHELNNALIKDNESVLSLDKVATISSEEQALNRCKSALKTLPNDKVIMFLETEFSMLEPDVIRRIINNLMFELPFGDSELKSYLDNKQEEINNITREQEKKASGFESMFK